jgi:hypothetical protein
MAYQEGPPKDSPITHPYIKGADEVSSLWQQNGSYPRLRAMVLGLSRMRIARLVGSIARLRGR